MYIVQVSSLNMAVKRHNKDRLWSLKYFAGFLPRPTFTRIILETIWSQNSSMSCHFQNVLDLCVQGGREPPDAMSLRYADTSLPDLLGRPRLHYANQASAMQTKPPLCRPSLHYADQASAMQTVPLLCSKRASKIEHSFFKILVLYV